MNKEQLLRSLRKEKFPEDIVKAFSKVEREDFVPKDFKIRAYEDTALHIGKGQTISQPYTIAFMLMLLEIRDDQKILEVGSGSGYVLALINEISKNSRLYGIERISEIAQRSKSVLSNKKNITLVYGDGSKGLPDAAPFDRILVSASADSIPQKLLKQLKMGGILVVPVRNSIIYLKKYINENQIKEFPGFAFVPFVEGSFQLKDKNNKNNKKRKLKSKN